MKKVLIGLIVTSLSLLAEEKCLPVFFNFVDLKEKKYDITFSEIKKVYQREMGTLIIRERDSNKEKILIVNKETQLDYLKCIIPFASSINWTKSSIRLKN